MSNYSLKNIDEPIWINGQSYTVPVIFDFSPYWDYSGFNNRVIVRLMPFDEQPILDNFNSQNLGRHLYMRYFATSGDSAQKKKFIKTLGEFWELQRKGLHDSLESFEYNIEGGQQYYTMALLIPSQNQSNEITLICFGIEDGESRRPDMAVIHKVTKITTDEDINCLFRS